MAKNNILLAVLVASFTAPVFTSFLPTKCPLNQNQKLAATTLVVDQASSRYLGFKPAFELRSNVAAQPVVVVKEENPEVNNVVQPAAAAPVKSLKDKVLDTNVKVGLTTVGINGELQVNVVPLVVKVVAAAGLLKAVDVVTAKLTSAKK